MKKTLLLLILFSSKLFSQPACQWAYMAMSATNANHTVFNAIYDLNGDIIQAGLITGVVDMNPSPAPADTAYSFVGYNFYLAKYSSGGVLLWIKYFKSLGSFATFDFTGIAINSSNDIIVTGNYFGLIDFDLSDAGVDTIRSHFPTYPDYFVAKYSPNGNYQWAFSIGATQNNTIESRSVLIQPNDDIVVVAHPNGMVDVDPSAAVHNCIQGNAVLVCYDVNGNYVWDTNNFPSNYSYAQYDKSFDSDATGNIFLMTVGYYELTVTKFSATSTKLWERKIGDFTSQARVNPQSVLVDKQSGDFYVAGTFGGTVDFDPGVNTSNLTSSSWNYQDGFIAKYDANMNLLWANQYAGKLEFGKFSLDFFGNEIISAGKMSGTIDFGNGVTLSASAAFNPFYLKLSTTGITSEAFVLNGTGYFNSIVSSGTHAFLITGGVASNTDMDPSTSNYTLTSNTSGFVAFYNYSPNAILQQAEAISFKVYPNPSCNFIQLTLKQKSLIELTDAAGKVFYCEKGVEEGEHFIDVSFLANGIYFLRCNYAVRRIEVLR